MGDSQYSFSLTTFSPSGKLVQIEHALQAVSSGQTSLGIKASNGVVVATEKKLPSILVDESSVKKIQLLTPNIGVAYSGMGPDSRVLVRKSRKQAQQYFRVYKENIPVLQLVRETAAVMQEFTQSGGVRPFGVSLLVAGYDDNGPQLYQVDPSGSYFSWKASAIGKNVSNAKTFLEKRWILDKDSGQLRIPYLQTDLSRVLRRYAAQIHPNRIELRGYRISGEAMHSGPSDSYRGGYVLVTVDLGGQPSVADSLGSRRVVLAFTAEIRRGGVYYWLRFGQYFAGGPLERDDHALKLAVAAE
ncbi:hypothetical protein L7F22_024149 [Adiantum nelumboides]|nr:hypothetical protein [Adiantum nelumboides]